PRAVVVVSDGRLQRPAPVVDDAALARSFEALGAPLHTVRLTEKAPPDASVREVSAAGAAVAHQPLALKVTVGCAGGLPCDALPVTVRELQKGARAVELARGVAKPGAGEATVDLEVTVERAGRRVLEIAIAAPDGDKVAANDTRFITLDVARERVRLLHVAGRPTYDVRQLRMWLKADESIDLVGFFILRTNGDSPNVVDESSELSLIPFPVEALFTQHLPSFDAVMLQDIDAFEYKLDPYLPALAAYVRAGGGLIMVGGPSAFAGGGYAGSPLEAVLPAELPRQGEPYDLRGFVPAYTAAGRAAPTLAGVIELLGDALPRMDGSNTLGRARPGSIVLWEHAERRVDGQPMPVLALAEVGDGRSIALAVDGTHELGFGELAERAGGRAYGALWDGLLGWLMRDPRYEVGHVSLLGACIAGEPVKLSLVPPPGASGEVELELERLGEGTEQPLTRRVPLQGTSATAEVGPLAAGGYSARMKVGAAPPTRFDFACEDGGLAFRDSRPDPERLERIARVTGGRSVTASGAADLPLPEPTDVTLERHSKPLLPAWIWTLAAAAALGAHWLVRRQRGLA
ncbi:MAG TPA: glutamine amidotransferase, partial [Polyangiaceae bacterium]